MKPNEDSINGSVMGCEQVEEQNVIERYIHETLSAKETEAFEQHYLGCKRCFGELQMRHAAAIELKRLPPAASSARIWWKPAWQWGLAFTLLAVVIAGLSYFRSRPQSSPPVPQIAQQADANATVLEQLAALQQIPPYLPGMIRGAESNQAVEKFQIGMQEYVAGHYSEAVNVLLDAVKLDPQLKPAVFYLGVSYLIIGKPDDAIQQLSTLRSDPNYSEDSRWHLAKAYLRKRDIPSAISELQAVAALKGPRAGQASQDLERLKSLSITPR